MVKRLNLVMHLCVLSGMMQPVLAQEQLYIYPMWGQSDEKKQEDKLDCYNWAAEQSGVDPIGAAMERSEAIRAATQNKAPSKGGGALARREAQEQAERQKRNKARTEEEAQAEYERKMQLFNPPFVECLEQRGYSVR